MIATGRWTGAFARLAVALAVGAAAAAALAALWGVAPRELADRYLGETFDRANLAGYMNKWSLYVLVGLAVAIPLRAGLFNVGGPGQILAGGFAGAMVGVWLGWLPAPVLVPAVLAAAAAAGAAWGAAAGALKAWRGAHEVVTTIMLNFLAAHLVGVYIQSPLNRPEVGQTAAIAAAARPAPLATIDGYPVTAIVSAAPVAALAAWWFLGRTGRGFELRLWGTNPEAAGRSGVSGARVIVGSMAAGGCLAGLAAGLWLVTKMPRMDPHFISATGFEAIGVAILGLGHPVGVVLAAGLMANLGHVGPGLQQSLGISRHVLDVVQGILILLVGVRSFGVRLTRRPGWAKSS
jgi:simple sugar transport system permease protein